MYCPNCSAESPERAGYCRSCGCNLKAIQQALSGHLPLLLASSIDSLVDRKSQQFLLSALMLIPWASLVFLCGFSLPIVLSVVILAGGMILREWLAYRRARKLENRMELEAAHPPTYFFCPYCGADNPPEVSNCRRCGMDVKAVSLAITGNVRTWLDRHLDRYIQRRDKRFADHARHGLLGSLISALLGAVILIDPLGAHAAHSFVFFSVYILNSICLLANLVIYKRTGRRPLFPGSDQSRNTSPELGATLQHSQGKNGSVELSASPPSITEGTTQLMVSEAHEEIGTSR